MKRSLGCWLTLAALMLGACDGTQGPSTTGDIGTQATGTQATQPGGASQEVQVFFGLYGSNECDEVESYPRLIPADSDPIRGAFDARSQARCRLRQGPHPCSRPTRTVPCCRPTWPAAFSRSI
jgi:hypothetical protein